MSKRHQQQSIYNRLGELGGGFLHDIQMEGQRVCPSEVKSLERSKGSLSEVGEPHELKKWG